MSKETVVTNARIITKNEIIDGTLSTRDGEIQDICSSVSKLSNAIDFEGDFCVPGLVELHTDNLEKHFKPMPGVSWPAEAAVMAHDAQMATAGITTVLDAIRVGDTWPDSHSRLNAVNMAKAIRGMKSKNMLRSDHFFHIRCEISNSDVLDEFEYFLSEKDVRLVSLMDHTPGQRQFVDEAKYREYYQGKYSLTDDAMETMIERQKADQLKYSDKHRATIVEKCQAAGLSLASHDDAKKDHIETAASEGVKISEFPTTIEAALAARGKGLKILMGAPNLVLGGSHSGNISAMVLAKKGLLDVLSSDYVPASLMHGAFLLNHNGNISLPDAVASVSAVPAQLAGLEDRGEIKIGRRADFSRVKVEDAIPMMSSVWREGNRII